MEEQFFAQFQIPILLLYFMVVFFYMACISVVIFNDEVYGFSSCMMKLPLADGPEY